MPELGLAHEAHPKCYTLRTRSDVDVRFKIDKPCETPLPSTLHVLEWELVRGWGWYNDEKWVSVPAGAKVEAWYKQCFSLGTECHWYIIKGGSPWTMPDADKVMRCTFRAPIDYSSCVSE
jgi:hypothetical protein